MSPQRFVLIDFRPHDCQVVLAPVGEEDEVTDPFIADAARRLAGGQWVAMGLAEAAEQLDRRSVVCGIIAHTGRCGSTLVTNLLRADRDCWIVGESPAISSALIARATGNIDDSALRSVIDLAATDPTGRGRPAIIKLSSWNGALLCLLPTVQTALLWAPVERVASSLIRASPRWLDELTGPTEFRRVMIGGVPAGDVALEIARLWNRIVDGAISTSPSLVLRFNGIRTDPVTSVDRVRTAFGLAPRGATSDRQEQRGIDAKSAARALFTPRAEVALPEDIRAKVRLVVGDREDQLRSMQPARPRYASSDHPGPEP